MFNGTAERKIRNIYSLGVNGLHIRTHIWTLVNTYYLLIRADKTFDKFTLNVALSRNKIPPFNIKTKTS